LLGAAVRIWTSHVLAAVHAYMLCTLGFEKPCIAPIKGLARWLV
jgi:hypothetical protein